ncbi:MAG TPA: hypothetical protein PLO56_11550 [Rhodothermales bacterium]|nr:hypothetical protein [Rhodothermales bacterium]
MQKIFGYLALALVAAIVLFRGASSCEKPDFLKDNPPKRNPDSVRAKVAPPRAPVAHFSVFREEFEDNHNKWSIREEAGRSYAIVDGRYRMNNRAEKTFYWSNVSAPGLSDSLDYVVETKLVKLSGINNNSYAVIWGLDNTASRFYAFGITGDGQYRVSRFENRTWTDLIALKDAKAIRKKDKQENVLTVQKKGFKLYFLINGKQVDSLPVYPLFGNGIGFGLNSPMEIEVDYIRVARL